MKKEEMEIEIGIENLLNILKETANSEEVEAEDREAVIIMEDILDDIFSEIDGDPNSALANMDDMIKRMEEKMNKEFKHKKEDT